MSLFESASLVVTPNGTKASKLYAIKPTSGAGDLSVTRATTATRVNSAGLIESVAVNVPRLDYTNSTCPSILVEPQRTNLLTYSEDFTNIAWVKLNVTVSANAAISPDGTQNADLIYPTTTGSDRLIERAYVPSIIGNNYTTSFYIKPNGFTWALLYSPAIGNVWFNMVTGQFGTIAAGVTAKLNKIVNGYYNISLTQPAGSLATYFYVGVADANNSITATANGTNGIYLWGAQLEAGSYATSYIPTVASAVTRNADVISKTGISSLIGQTEGTFYLDINLKNIPINNSYIFLRNAGVTNYLGLRILNGLVRFETVTGGSPQTSISYAISETGTIKIAMAYKLNDFVFYINGIQIGVDNSATVPACDILDLNFDAPPSNAFGIKTTALWKTRLTNAELIELTTL